MSGEKNNQIGKKQQLKQLRHLKNKAQCALWLCKSYGLELHNIEFADEDGSSHTLDYCKKAHSGKYENLPEDERNKIEQVLYLMESFAWR